MNDNTVRLSLKEAFEQAESELALSEESDGTDISSDLVEETPEVEQLTVENPDEAGLFDGLGGDNDVIEQSDEELYPVTVQGEQRMVTLQEALNGYMRQEDYTIKTQEASEITREAEKALTLMRLLEEQPVETLRKLYQRINAGQTLDFVGETSLPNVQQTKGPNDIEALVEARVAEMLENHPQLQSIKIDHARQQIESIFGKIEGDYGVKLTDSDKQKVLEDAQAKGTTDLEMVFGALYAQKLKADRQRDLERRNAKNVSPLQGQSRSDSHPVPQKPKKYDSFKSALLEEMALAEQGITTVSAL